MLDTVTTMVKEKRLGFTLREIMSGVHEFAPGCGPEGRRPMEFRVTWGTKQVWGNLNPFADVFLRAELEGTVTVDGLCTDARCQGSFELRYFSDHTIRYAFEFEAGGKTYAYLGTKVNIQPWNLPVSHTTCFGTITEKDTGKLISRSVVYFKLWRMPAFISSLRPA